MTDQLFPITPPPELVRQWVAKNYVDLPIEHVEVHLDDVKICTAAARWGSDQELEACCEHLKRIWAPSDTIGSLLQARRPKPPSLKEQALKALTQIEDNGATYLDSSVIRRALNQLPDE